MCDSKRFTSIQYILFVPKRQLNDMQNSFKFKWEHKKVRQ